MSTGMESPQSVSLVGYYKGFSVTVTKRDAEAKVLPLINDAMEAIDHMIAKGFKPSWNEETNGKALSQPAAVSTPKTSMSVDEFEQKCPDCGAKKIRSKKGNMVCSNYCWTK